MKKVSNGCQKNFEGSGFGCGSVGTAVTSDTRGLRFKSSHRQKFILNICLLFTQWKRRKRKEETLNGPFKKQLCLIMLNSKRM